MRLEEKRYIIYLDLQICLKKFGCINWLIALTIGHIKRLGILTMPNEVFDADQCLAILPVTITDIFTKEKFFSICVETGNNNSVKYRHPCGYSSHDTHTVRFAELQE